jgi:hypothetical protein
MRHHRVFLTLAALLAACGSESHDVDAGEDAGPGLDASSPDAGGSDAGGSDAGGSDAGLDAAADGAVDASVDAGPFALFTFPPRDFVCSSSLSPCVTDTPRTSDAERTIAVRRDVPRVTHTYVLHRMAVPEATTGAAPQAAGFNLDGLDSGDGSISSSANCEEYNPDYASLRDPGHIGVDNALQSLVPTIESLLDSATCPGGTTDGCLDATIAEQIASGTLLLLVEITGLDSYAYDTEVDVTIYLGAVPGGGLPLLDGSGLIAPGQTFDTVSTLATSARADIFDGRLQVRWATLTLPMDPGLLLPSRLERVEMRANVTADALAFGQMGGTAPIDDFVARAEAIMPGIGPTVRSVMEAISDVTVTSDPVVCADVSAGLTFEAVAATRTP